MYFSQIFQMIFLQFGVSIRASSPQGLSGAPLQINAYFYGDANQLRKSNIPLRD